MEAAHCHLDACSPEWPRDVERTWILVRLHAHQRKQSEVSMLTKTPDQLRYVDVGIWFIDCVNVDVDIRTKHLPLRSVERQAVNGGK